LVRRITVIYKKDVRECIRKYECGVNRIMTKKKKKKKEKKKKEKGMREIY
jgi:hypothetical protein